MNNHSNWIQKRLRTGWIFLIFGLLVIIAGVVKQLSASEGRPFDLRIISALGIVLAGWGIGQIVRYRSAAKDDLAAKRLVNEELDERTLSINAKAGNRAFWASAIIVYAGLMWVSLAANGQLPRMNEDMLWYFLAFAFVFPFAVYIVNIIQGQRYS